MRNEITVYDNEYTSWLQELKERYLSQQLKAHSAVLNYYLEFYWSVGKDIVSKQSENKYGSGFYKRLSNDLKNELPGVKGLSPTNLKYMKYFYELYKDVEIRQQAVDEFSMKELFSIPWGHHVTIIDKCKSNEKKAIFFVNKTRENNWSRQVLLNFLDTDLYERQGKAITNFSNTLPAPQGELAQQITKDPYTFDFLAIREKYEEAELKDALIANIEKFLLELGRGFAYMGREFRLEVGSEEKFMDMLFYNTNLHCYVVVEVKITKFKAADLGQLGEVADTFTGLTYSPENIYEHGTLVLRSSNIKNGQLCFEDNVYVQMPISERAIVKENDILICVRNGSKTLIGKSSLITKNAVGMAFGAFMTVLRSKTINQKYLLYVWQSDLVQKQVSDNLGATINQITNSDFKKFNIVISPDQNEQQRIAKALSDVDALISTTEKLIQKKKNIKQGTMQNLLTGKKRLPGFAPQTKSPTYKQTELGPIPDDWEVKNIMDILISSKDKLKIGPFGSQLKKEYLLY